MTKTVPPRLRLADWLGSWGLHAHDGDHVECLCGTEAVYVASSDLFVHVDGSSAEDCICTWIRGVR